MDTSVAVAGGGPRGTQKAARRARAHEWDFSFRPDLTARFRARRARHFWRQRERVVFDTCRLAQPAAGRGRSTSGARFEVEPQRWWAAATGPGDSSGGARAAGDTRLAAVSMLWNYAQIQFEDTLCSTWRTRTVMEPSPRESVRVGTTRAAPSSARVTATS